MEAGIKVQGGNFIAGQREQELELRRQEAVKTSKILESKRVLHLQKPC